MATRQTAPRDPNRVPGLLGAANDGSLSPVDIQADPLTGRLLVNSIISGGLSLPAYDYVSNATSSTTDTYSFYRGGSSGILVSTIALVYTDATKATLSTVTKT